MIRPQQGEVWWGEAEDKRRPVLVVTRSEAAGVLHGIVVAPVTRRIRGIRTEVRLGPEDGLPHDCVASFDNLQVFGRTLLTERLGGASEARRLQICRALRALADCP
ncbi:MAG: type II toxin-antitoxin system PemK/MazF family toxin [Gaiella sp.]|nr:type II toxin-antitoxin system PemK/MazF family toxin [Gaiella sp.]